MVARMKMTPGLAVAAGFDAANAQMRRSGRTRWNSADAELASTTQAKLMQSCGTYHQQLAADEVLRRTEAAHPLPRNFPF